MPIDVVRCASEDRLIDQPEVNRGSGTCKSREYAVQGGIDGPGAIAHRKADGGGGVQSPLDSFP